MNKKAKILVVDDVKDIVEWTSWTSLKIIHFIYSIPTVILSTSSDQETIRRAYEKGANGYIVKPLSYDEFVDKIRVLRKYC